jgi:HSP20 family protein
MSLRETLPWNWGKKEVPVKHEGGGAGARVAPRSVHDLLDELRSRPFGAGWSAFPELGEGFGFAEGSGFLPALDAKETDDEVRITVELPGLEEKDIEVGLRDDVLTIRGEKRDESRHEEGGSQWVERRYGSFRRTIPLPADVDAANVKAHFKSGVLKVVIPRTGKPEESHRSIPIQSQ